MSRSSRPRGARLLVLTAATVAVAGAGLCAAPLATAAPTVAPASTTVTGGGFVPVAASRVIDTRSGLGVPAKGKVGPNASVTSTLASRGGLPAAGGATAVVLNLTSANSTTGTYLTAYPGGASVPNASSVNVAGGVTTANLVTVPLSSTGTISVYNKAGSTDVIADVIGYYSATDNASFGGLMPLDPERYYDSRDAGDTFGTGDYIDLFNDFSSGSTDHNGDVTGWVVNVTAVNPTGDGYVTAWDGSGTKPGTSSLNFRRGVTTANLVEVKRGTTTFQGKALPSFRLQTTMFGGRTGLIADIVGVYTKPGTSADARFVPLATPQRIVDTRDANSPNLAPNATREFSAAAVGTSSTIAVAANLTVAGSTAPTYVSVYAGSTAPSVSSINAGKGAVIANASIFEVSPGSTSAGSFNAYNSAGTTPFLVDVAGTFDASTTAVAPASSSWRSGQPGAARG